MTERHSALPIEPVFLERWSPRAFDGRPLTEAELHTVLEAARWAPSAYNYQPWHFHYALNGDAHWDAFMSALVPFNQSWASNAGALLYVVTDTLMESASGKSHPNHSHSFDAGAAWAHLALQAYRSGLAAHGMTGVDFDAARAVLNLPDRYRVEAAIAVGHPAPAETLPEGLREREVKSDRKPLHAIMTAGPVT